MRYFTADTHFGHGRIRALSNREFETGDGHDEYLLDRINSTVGEQDELFILGDFAFDHPGKYRAKIKCKYIRFLMGNHDRVEKSRNVFGETLPIQVTKLRNDDGEQLSAVMCHYPMAYWPMSHHGSVHLYGHVHGNREATLDDAFPGRRSMDVGMDNARRLLLDYIPFSEQFLFHYLSNNLGHDFPSFYDSLRKGVTDE